MSGYPDLAEIKTYLGITDNNSDAFLTHKLAVSIRLIESYVRRVFPKEERTETYGCTCDARGNHLFLRALPVESVKSVTGMVNWKVTPYGLCTPVGCGGRPACTDDVTVTYTGGFDPVPDDIIDVIYDMMGAAHATMGVVASAAGTVKKETIYGVASVEYVVDAASASADTSGNNPLLPAYYAHILDGYRIYLA